MRKPQRIRAIQLARLIDQVEWTYGHVSWYRERMDEMGVKPSDIKTLDDVRKLPFTDKAVLRDTFPYGLFAVPLDEVVELHASSGTTGKPIVVGYNKEDMDLWADCIMRLVQMAGVVPSDRVQMAFGYGMFTGGFGLHYGLQRLGCMMIPRDGQYGAADSDDSRLRIDRLCLNAVVRTACMRGRREDGLRLGKEHASRRPVRR
ncbi:MAG: phenylacetate--CoA ligase family protein [Eggerthellaceae bacterium]